MLWLIPVPEHVFPNKPQKMIAHLLGFGAVTRDGIKSVLMAGFALSLLDKILDSLISRLKLEGPLLKLLPGVPLT